MRTRLLSALLALPVVASVAPAQWSTFHGDAQRSGRSAFVGPPAPAVQWRRDVGGPILSSPAIAPDGSIVLGAVLHEGLHPTIDVVATRADGTPKWSFRTGYVDTQVQTSPAIAPDGTVYVGAQDGRFYALRDDGTLRWSFAGTKPIVHHPVIAPDGTVYVGIDGDLHAFTPAGALLWKTTQGDLVAPGGPSLATDGTIYVFGGSQGVYSRVYAFRPDGTRRWSYDLFDPSFYSLSAPTVGPDGTIHVVAERLYALNPDGTLKWFNNLSSPLSTYGSAAVDLAGNVYLASHYYAWKVNAAGTVVWQYLINPGCGSFLGHSYGSPLVDATGRVYLGLGTGKRSAIACEKKMLVFGPNGGVTASVSFADIPGTSSPALASDGTMYVGTLDGGLYALR